MGIFSRRNKNGDRSVNLSFVDGLDGYSKGNAVQLSLNDENQCLRLVSRISKDKPTVNLKYNQILQANVVSEKDIVEKSKSVGGRAVVGGLFLGPLGAVIGGMSGIGNKKNADTHYYLVVNYKSQTEEIKALIFEIVGASLHWSSFVTDLRSKINIENNIEEMYL